jgi:CO dehydrogenase/acetyl-CoA synthase beta subunit
MGVRIRSTSFFVARAAVVIGPLGNLWLVALGSVLRAEKGTWTGRGMIVIGASLGLHGWVTIVVDASLLGVVISVGTLAWGIVGVCRKAWSIR